MDNARYYDTHARSYINGTVDADLSSLYDRFLPYLSPGCSILDAGCGSGRDLKFFSSRGYQCTGFDASAEMVKAAGTYSGCPVYQGTFETFNAKQAYDAIWACASLLHVRHNDMKDVFRRINDGLKNGGILYCSFKEGVDFTRDDRSFTCFTAEVFSKFIQEATPFFIVDQFISEDVRPGRKTEYWINAILKKRQ
ncbi:MAG: methyltransferase domain-containing protein [Sphaerochaetaceae bacterium]|nr:methyltransferase domain-containing protein [Sphaerochaetaceae bacterium]